LKKKILVTGSEGLVGSSIIKFIPKKKFKIIKTDKKLNLKHQIEKENFINILDFEKPDIIIHTAAHPGGLSMQDPLQNIKINLTGTFKIINWCMQNKKKIIFISSSAVYGDNNKKKLNEKMPLNPGTVYGINKMASESYITELSKYNKFPWLIIRLFATYGHGHKPNLYQGIVNIILTQLNNGNILNIKGSLSRTRDLIYADDAGKIISNLIEQNLDKKIINVGSGKSTEIKKLIKICLKFFPNNKHKIRVLKKTPGDPFSSVADISLLKKYIKNFKYTKLQEGIDKTLKLIK
jgi:UDP-glucose 4-epimerase